MTVREFLNSDFSEGLSHVHFRIAVYFLDLREHGAKVRERLLADRCNATRDQVKYALKKLQESGWTEPEKLPKKNHSANHSTSRTYEAPEEMELPTDSHGFPQELPTDSHWNTRGNPSEPKGNFDRELERESLSGLPGEEVELLLDIRKRTGLPGKHAHQLVETYGRLHCRKQLDLLDMRGSGDPIELFVAAVQEDWPDPRETEEEESFSFSAESRSPGLC